MTVLLSSRVTFFVLYFKTVGTQFGLSFQENFPEREDAELFLNTL